jgi:putative spermidine/putrescine transport system permease protein
MVNEGVAILNERIEKGIFSILAILTLIFALLPIVMLFVGALNPAPFFTFPMESVSLKWFNAFLVSKEFQSALKVSLIVSVSAVCIGICAGVPTAFAIKRFDFYGKEFINSLVMSSMTLPRVIWAISLLQFYSFLGILGTYQGLILAHSLLVIPYVVRMVISSLSFVSEDFENAALSLGASPLRTFREITFPLILPGVIVSAFFGFVVSFTDSVVAVFISGVRNITFPVRIYAEQRGQGLDPVAVAGSAIIILVIILVEMIGEKLFKWSRYV